MHPFHPFFEDTPREPPSAVFAPALEVLIMIIYFKKMAISTTRTCEGTAESG
jgi:hypothetical protein